MVSAAKAAREKRLSSMTTRCYGATTHDRVRVLFEEENGRLANIRRDSPSIRLRAPIPTVSTSPAPIMPELPPERKKNRGPVNGGIAVSVAARKFNVLFRQTDKEAR